MLMILARLVRSESFWAVVKVRSPHTGPEPGYPRGVGTGAAEMERGEGGGMREKEREKEEERERGLGWGGGREGGGGGNEGEGEKERGGERKRARLGGGEGAGGGLECPTPGWRHCPLQESRVPNDRQSVMRFGWLRKTAPGS